MLCPTQNNVVDNLCDTQGRVIQIFFVECVCTFFFVSVVLSVIYMDSDNKLVAGIVVSGALFACVACAAKYTGGAVNPAVGLVQTLFQSMMVERYPEQYKKANIDKNYSSTSQAFLYFISPLAGGVFAGLFK